MAANGNRYAAAALGSVARGLGRLLFVVSCVLPMPALAGTQPTIAFLPAHPTSRDEVIARLSVSDCGQTTTHVLAGTLITITTSAPTGCGTPPPETRETLGLLSPGTYQVQWYEQQQLTASAPLVVTGAPDPAPSLQPVTLLLLSLACGALGLAKFRRRRAH